MYTLMIQTLMDRYSFLVNGIRGPLLERVNSLNNLGTRLHDSHHGLCFVGLSFSGVDVNLGTEYTI